MTNYRQKYYRKAKSIKFGKIYLNEICNAKCNIYKEKHI